MPRKHFRRFLPSHEKIRGNRYIAFLGPRLHHPNLWHLNRRSVAGGVAVGMICGMIPGPIQTISAVVLAVMLRVNLPVALAASWYVNPFTVAPLYYLAYKIGVLLTGEGASASLHPAVHLTLHNLGDWIPLLFGWVTELGKPLLVGLAALGIALATAGYFAVLGAWRLYVVIGWRRRQRKRRPASDTSG